VSILWISHFGGATINLVGITAPTVNCWYSFMRRINSGALLCNQFLHGSTLNSHEQFHLTHHLLLLLLFCSLRDAAVELNWSTPTCTSWTVELSSPNFSPLQLNFRIHNKYFIFRVVQECHMHSEYKYTPSPATCHSCEGHIASGLKWISVNAWNGHFRIGINQCGCFCRYFACYWTSNLKNGMFCRKGELFWIFQF